MSAPFPERAPARPVWLITLADLALLLVGFFVLLQAQHLDRRALAQGLRQGFGAAAPAPEAPAMPVAAAAMLRFAPGSAALPESPAAVVAWAKEAAGDPRTTLTVTGSVDGSAGDVDPATRSGAILAADRGRALAAALAAGGVASGRLVIATATTRQRAATVTLGFTGQRP